MLAYQVGRHVPLSRSCLKCIWRWVWPEHCRCGDAWSCQHEFLLVSTKKFLNHTTLPTCLFTLGRLRLPRRKLWKIGIMLNMCPSHTEIFSKRRKIYSWLCERLELMWQPLKNGPASRALGNAFDLDLEFHWANDREIEARWGRTLVEDNCNNLAPAKVAGIARMPYNPLVFSAKKY